MLLVPGDLDRRTPGGLILPDRRIVPAHRCPYGRPRPRRRWVPDLGLAVAFDSIANTGTGDNKTCNRPGTSASGRIMVAAVTAYDSTTHTITSSGWTSIRATTFSGGGGSGKLETFVKVDNGSEAASYTWTISSGNYTNIAIGAWTGGDTGTPIDTSSGNTGTASPATATGVTAARNASKLIAVFIGYNLTSWSTPTGMTSRTTWDGANALFDEDVNSGATGNRTSTHTTNVWPAQLIVIQPPAAGGSAGRFFFAGGY